MTPGSSRTQASISAMARDLAARQHVVADRDLFERRAPRSRAGRRLRSGRTGSRRPALRPAPRPAPASAARRAGSSAGAAASPAPAASIARASTSARITMPGPPPAGVSSTRRCLSVACSRMSTLERPEPGRQRLAGEAQPSGPGNISGKIVSTVARHMAKLRCVPPKAATQGAFESHSICSGSLPLPGN